MSARLVVASKTQRAGPLCLTCIARGYETIAFTLLERTSCTLARLSIAMSITPCAATNSHLRLSTPRSVYMITTIAIVIFLVLILVPALLILQLFIISRRPQHSIIRSHPILGWLRYLLNKLGPEFRQYWFDDDRSGKPFSRYEFIGLIFSAKYRSDLIGFGSKRDFDKLWLLHRECNVSAVNRSIGG